MEHNLDLLSKLKLFSGINIKPKSEDSHTKDDIRNLNIKN